MRRMINFTDSIVQNLEYRRIFGYCLLYSDDTVLCWVLSACLLGSLPWQTKNCIENYIYWHVEQVNTMTAAADVPKSIPTK